ncbi:hypothetical protein CNMCM7691_008579 [Aspergillus felis]|uniref:Nephrocystin 3-like N-terminal domain-containing protein n=1 Tax=Aspergillus felis TaxID=1287682 RepID=A0A8H6QM30_9EURO|nr:hypothetical protein CNMCM7691_008579 [Aspergillus felis]
MSGHSFQGIHINDRPQVHMGDLYTIQQLVLQSAQNGGASTHLPDLANLFSRISEDRFRGVGGPANVPESVTANPVAFANKFQPYDYQKLFYQTAGDIQEGTCQWLVENPVIKTWLLDKSYSVVWLTGSPGMGKTSLVVNFAQSYHALLGENRRRPNDTAVLYSLCDRENNDLGKILCVAIHQLLEPRAKEEFGLEAIDCAYELFASEELRSKECWNLFPRLLWTYFCNLCIKSNLKKVYLLIDGIDECNEETQKELFGLLKQGPSIPSNLRVLISSQPLENVRIMISKMKSLKIECLDLHLEDRNVNLDIDRHIGKEVDLIGELRGYSASQIAETKDYLKERKCGTFLPIVLVLLQLQESPVCDLETILQESANKLEDLDLLYEAQLRRMSLAMFRKPSRLLSNLLYSYRPLTVSELACLCQYPEERRTPGHEQDGYLRHRGLRNDLRLLGPILRIRVSDDTVQFIHSSARKFLLERWPWTGSRHNGILHSPSEGHKALALSCLQILIKCSDFITKETPYPWEDNRGCKLDKVMRKHQLLAYARLYWDSHVKEMYRSTGDNTEDCGAVVEKFAQISDLYADDRTGRLHLFLAHRPNGGRQYKMLPSFEFAPSDEIKRVLRHKEQDFSPRYYAGTPLVFYARFGNKELFHNFIQRQGEKMALVRYERHLSATVLQNAALNGDVSLVQALVDAYGREALSVEKTPGLLYLSSSSGRSELVNYFRETIPVVDLDEFLASVTVAAQNDDVKVLNELLESWTTEIRDLHGLNVLQRLTTCMRSLGGSSSIGPDGFLEVSTLLIERGLDLNEADNMGNTVLHHLAWNSYLGTLEVFKQLIDYGADPTRPNNGGALPVHLAAHIVDYETFEFLLSATEEVEAYKRNMSVMWQSAGSELPYFKSHGDLTPLHWAASRRFDDDKNSVEIIKTMLSRGFQMTDVTRNGRTPIKIALEDPSAFDNFLYIAISLDGVHNVGVSTRLSLIDVIFPYAGKRGACRDVVIDWPRVYRVWDSMKNRTVRLSERRQSLIPDIPRVIP